METHFLLLLVTVIFLTVGCTQSKQLTLYSSVDRSYSEQLLDGISEEVHLVGDTESAKSTGLINRLLAERNRPVADVFLSGDPMRTAFLEKKNIGKAYKDREVEEP